MELAEEVDEFEKKYTYDLGLPLTNKKIVKRMCNAYYATCTEMSTMCAYFATAGEDDIWKSWVTSDVYLETQTCDERKDAECSDQTRQS